MVLLIVCSLYPSTQQSLDEGVEKMKEIYKSFADVGITDRSLIWNSCVGIMFSDAY